MAKKPNFGFEKRQKDLKKQQKREEKAEKKRLKREGGGEEEQGEGGEHGEQPQADGNSEPLNETDPTTP